VRSATYQDGIEASRAGGTDHGYRSYHPNALVGKPSWPNSASPCSHYRLRHAIADHAQGHPDFPCLTLAGAGRSLPPPPCGLWRTTGVRLCEELQKYAGIAPVTEPKRENNPGCTGAPVSEVLATNVVEWAAESSRHSSGAAYYQQQRTRAGTPGCRTGLACTCSASSIGVGRSAPRTMHPSLCRRSTPQRTPASQPGKFILKELKKP